MPVRNTHQNTCMGCMACILVCEELICDVPGDVAPSLSFRCILECACLPPSELCLCAVERAGTRLFNATSQVNVYRGVLLCRLHGYAESHLQSGSCGVVVAVVNDVVSAHWSVARVTPSYEYPAPPRVSTNLDEPTWARNDVAG